MPTAMPLSAPGSPPKPPLAFRVGVVGHRPDRLGGADPDRLAKVLKEVLATVQDEVSQVAASEGRWFADAPPVLRAISPLAEGTDRIFADQALALGWELCCVMPFPRDEYEKDFQPGNALEQDSLARFRGILESASGQGKLTVLQLDGTRDEEGKAYGAGGRVVLGLCDLLVAVWDGDAKRDKEGGTRGTMKEAMAAGIPVLWVDARAPHAILPDADGLGDLVRDPVMLRQAVRSALCLPEPDRREHAGQPSNF